MFFFSLTALIITAAVHTSWLIAVAAIPMAIMNAKMVFMISDFVMDSSTRRASLLFKKGQAVLAHGMKVFAGTQKLESVDMDMKEEIQEAAKEVWLCELFEVICWAIVTAAEVGIINFMLRGEV